MKKVIYCILLVIVFLGGIIIGNTNKDNYILENTKTINNSDTLSMMYETEFGKGEYIVSSSLKWPDSQSYSFNPRLSKCENGGTLSWDSTTNQVIMTGDKSDKCYVYFDIAPYHVTCSDNTLACQITKTYTSDGVNNLYYHDGYGDYTNSDLEAGDYSYRYAGGDYVLTDKAIGEGYGHLINSRTITDGLINSYCDGELHNYGCNSSNAIKTYSVVGDSTAYNTIMEAFNSAINSGYITSDNIKNYVCFGSTASTCPDENLYRILGVFKNDSGTYNVKLISANFATLSMIGDSSVSSDCSGYEDLHSVFNNWPYRGTTTTAADCVWGKANKDAAYEATGYYTVWSYSFLNTKHLNDYYLNTYLGSTWSSKIENHTWAVGGATKDDLFYSDAKTTYVKEIINPSNEVEPTYYSSGIYPSKVALMYVSDFYYSALPKYWNTFGTDDYPIDDVWLSVGGAFDRILTRVSGSTQDVAIVSPEGITGWQNYYVISSPIRPTFYLNSNVTLTSGTGTLAEPYRIN